MYACNAGRALGFSTVEESGSQVHHSVNEGVEKILSELSEITSTKSSTRGPSVSPVEAETIVIHEKASSGADIISLCTSQTDHEQKSIKMKGLKRQARSLLGSATQDNDMKEDHNTDSEGNSNEAAIDEDVGVMDYANPHRKPPIHNQKP